MIRIVHIITGLNTGGAETMLATLLAHTPQERFQPTVICLTADGPVGDRIRALGVPVHILGMPRGLPTLGGVLRLVRLLHSLKPEVVQTWLYHSDLIGGITARLLRVPIVTWSIHNTVYDPRHAKRMTVLIGRLCARLSSLVPHRILSCSQTAMQEHIALGYPNARVEFIPNGFDLAQYSPNNNLRQAVRQELGIPDDAPLVGLFARFDPMKDHQNFVQAAQILTRTHSKIAFLLCGQNITADNTELWQWIVEANLQNHVHLLGVRTDVPRLLCALDVLTLSSRYGEAFPMILGEAMATGVPCVATDVGDAAYIIGDTGRIVPPAEPERLGQALHELLSLPAEKRCVLGHEARERIQRLFEIGHIAESYASFYEKLLKH